MKNKIDLRKNNLGAKVTTNMGIIKTGVIIPPFNWQQSTDGTYKEPDKKEIAIQWDNGLKGYMNTQYLNILSSC